MNNRLKIMRDGIPHYVAPWVASLSPNARKMIGTGPSRHDPKGQLGLPIPDMQSEQPVMLDFGPVLPCKTRPSPAKSKPARSDMETEMLAALIALTDWMRDHTGPRDPDSPHDLLVAAMATIAKATT